MDRFVIAIQIVAVFLLFAESLYICFRRPSRMQVLMLITVVSTIITLVGYTVELTAKEESVALLGVAIAYIGKPYALLAPFLFILDYCQKDISRTLTALLAVFNLLFPLMIFTNGSHHLYYSWVEFDRSRPFSPLRLGHGPLYYLYLLKVLVNFFLILHLTLKRYRTETEAEARAQLVYLFGMVFSSVAGYAVFLTGVTRGYDTTIIGAIVGTVLLSILFFRYRLFDVVTLAQEEALNGANFGILVLDGRNRRTYANQMMDTLLSRTFRMEELLALPYGKTEIYKGSAVYEVSRSYIVDRGRIFGKKIEVTDVTDRHNYSKRLEEEVDVRTEEIRRIQRSVVSSFAGIVEARDNSTGEHIFRMSRYVDVLARSLRSLGYYGNELTDGYITSLVEVAPLHDIGKISVPDGILLKPGKLTDEEFAVIKTHTLMGARVIDQCLSGVERPEYVTLAREVALCHHEKWDGSGYPNGLRGEDIPLSGRIIAVADVYDAVRSQRVYKPAMSPEEARQVILDGSGSHFAPQVVEAFEHAMDEIEAVAEE